ncbi:MAG: hypothetical protein IJW03_04140 [Clostridia bacterium]|nr:hypothetical protein [Clostridia bacterium]
MNETVFIKGGSEYIGSLIQRAVNDRSRTATVTGSYEIDSAVRIPSDFTLILEDCHLRMADGCYSNMFVNEHHGTDIGKTLEGRDRNISVIGRGYAILDGGKYNGLSERTQRKNGLPPIYKNNLLLFTNVEGFKISNVSCKNQRWWALNFVYCSNGYLGNIDFCACDVGIDENGNEYHGLKRDKYSEVLVKNADGIDIRQGCHDIVIENITGFTEDDTVALTGLCGYFEEEFAVKELSSDIANVTIKNVASEAFCTNVRLLNQGGIRLHDILIDGVRDTSEGSAHMDRGIYAVRIGDNYLYGSRHATEDETYNIAVKNVYSRANYAISLAGAIKNLTIDSIECAEGTEMLLDERTNK